MRSSGLGFCSPVCRFTGSSRGGAVLPQRRSVRPPRLALVAVLALLEVGAAALMLSYDLPIGTYGFLVGTDGVTIAAVEPASPAARAGILPGDRLIYATLPLRGRRAAAFQEEVPGDAPISFQVVHDGRTRSVTLRAESAPTAGRIETLTYACAGLGSGTGRSVAGPASTQRDDLGVCSHRTGNADTLGRALLVAANGKTLQVAPLTLSSPCSTRHRAPQS